VVTVILLPLTLVTGLFGMNVGVPGEGELEAFWVLVSVMAVIGLGLLALFRGRRWL
jgi:Mg2+ and Co2+ transporter CorA